MTDLEILEANYRQEQQDIVARRRAGGFASAEEDIQTQKDSWENYLFNHFKLTHSQADADKIIGYFGEKAMAYFVSIRDQFFAREITLTDYIKKRDQIAVDFETMMIEHGLATERMTTIEHYTYWTRVRQKELDMVPIRQKLDLATFTSLCREQYPIGKQYFQDYFEKYVGIQK